jgi:hypothetical protein
MRGRAALGLLAGSLALGVMAYVVIDRYVYEHGINIDVKLIATVGALLVIAVALVVAWRRKGGAKTAGQCSAR